MKGVNMNVSDILNRKKITRTIKGKRRPEKITAQQWANAINWTLAVWSCHWNRQHWQNNLAIVSPEHYHLLCDKNGQFIIPNQNHFRFVNNEPNKQWAVELLNLIRELKLEREFNEAHKWEKVCRKLLHDLNMSSGLRMPTYTPPRYKRYRINEAA